MTKDQIIELEKTLVKELHLLNGSLKKFTITSSESVDEALFIAKDFITRLELFPFMFWALYQAAVQIDDKKIYAEYIDGISMLLKRAKKDYEQLLKNKESLKQELMSNKKSLTKNGFSN